VPARKVPFDIDAGPGSNGRAVVAYSRCATEPTTADPTAFSGCRLYRYEVPNGPERQITKTVSGGRSHTHPAIWRGRIAWIETDDPPAKAPNPRLVLANLDGSGRRVINAVTKYRCWKNYDPKPPRICGPTTRRIVGGIDLSPAGVAISESYACAQAPGRGTGGCGGGFNQRDVVLARKGAHPRRIADLTAGEGGQTFVGPAFAGNALLFARACHGDPGGCNRGGARVIRYDMRRNRFTRADSPVALYGFAADAGRVYELFERRPDFGCRSFDVDASTLFSPCALVDAGALPFTTFRDGRQP